MKTYLLDFLNYSDAAMTRLLNTILILPDKTEAISLFSHLITSQDKWYNRLTQEQPDETFSWMGKVYEEDLLLPEWNRSTGQWKEYLMNVEPAALENYIVFTRASDGKKIRVKIKDVIFQLCIHGVHHRAQINKLFSAQHIPVPATDYILTAIEEVI